MSKAAWRFATVLLAASGLLGAADAKTQESVRAGLGNPSGAAASFSLVDERGRAVTDERFRGRFMLVYFGYTYCPDVCPLGLKIMSEAVAATGAGSERIVPIFITVDPGRDTSEVLAAYTDYFHPRLIGMTETREQIDDAEKTFGVRSFKLFLPPTFDDEDNERENDSDNSRYLMQHSASTYLVGPDGRLERVFPHETPAGEMARQIQEFVKGDL
jgi:protein SCO1/2